MKKARKLASLLLVLVMLFALAVPVMATGEATELTPGKITIVGAKEGEMYYLFKMLDLSYSTTTSGDSVSYNYTYTIRQDSKWYNFFADETKGGYYVVLSPNGTVKNDAGEDVNVYLVKQRATIADKDFANMAVAAQEYLDDINGPGAQNKPSETLPMPATVKKEVPKGATELTFDGLEFGYYLIYGSVGSIVGLDTNNANLRYEPKNPTAVLDKVVYEDGTDKWGDVNTAEFSETVKYSVTITNLNNLKNFTFYDVISKGLTLNPGSVVVSKQTTASVDDTPNAVDTPSDAVVLGTDYEQTCVAYEKDPDGTVDERYVGGQILTLSFKQDFMDKLSANDFLVISYNATVNDKALIHNAGNGIITDGSPYNPNKAQLTYGNKQMTAWDEVKTYVFEFDILKYTVMGGNPEHPLSGAEFTLERAVYKDDGTYDVQAAVIEPLTDGDGNIPAGNVVYKTDADGNVQNDSEGKPIIEAVIKGKLVRWSSVLSEATKIVSGSDGKIQVEGLDADVYRITETKSPEGYNLLTDPIVFEIYQDGHMTLRDGTANTTISILKVRNNTGAELPNTGGIGTTIFYVVGSVMMLAAVVLLVTKKRMSAN